MRMRVNYVKRLRDNCTRLWRQPRAGDASSLYSAELDIHVVRRREHLATKTTEERQRSRDTPVPALCSIHA